MAATSKLSDYNVARRAAIDGDLRVLKAMAKEVNLREAKDSEGRSALHLAAGKGHLEVCRFLAEELGLDVNSTTPDGSSPLHFAGFRGDESVLRYLVGRGGDPGLPDSAGATPLCNAAHHGNCEAVRVLLSMGVVVDALSNRGTPLHLAAANGYDQAVKMLLEHGADPNKVANFDFTPLVMACCGHSLKCMKLLVEAGADVNFVGGSGQSVLMTAVEFGFIDTVKFLVEAGADPNIAGEDGKIPIMFAAFHKQHELVEILFPLTRPIPSLPDWSIDGVIRGMEHIPFEPQITDPKSKGKEAFAKGDYLHAAELYGQAMEINPLDATLFTKRRLCWLRLRDGDMALSDAQHCKMLRPQALKLNPASKKIKNALRKAKACMKTSGSSREVTSESGSDISDE
ncbi:hypothetical protein HU200_008407 [Digitaria exilis]|uniref:Uncharacterized protein n=1 Tax=Digitaria exilis TaxID=1010633 RepID=A0A835FKV0_9POAL|nr:hypothetical protein HU200_014980 [Digitaria exilis]KAF8765580.1 hypothetical protein HU200_008407 [Digitaria exilis]